MVRSMSDTLHLQPPLFVSWQLGRFKKDIPSHECVKNYNHNMQGRAHHDQLTQGIVCHCKIMTQILKSGMMLYVLLTFFLHDLD
jgi:hypothetical protein